MLARLLLAVSLGLLLIAPAGCDKKSSDKTEAVATETEIANEPVPAETGSEPVEAAPAVAVIEKPFFYKVEGPNGESGYLLGTMHLGIDAASELPKSVWDAAGAARALAIEADIADLSVAKGLMLPEGQNLKDLLGEESWAQLVEQLGEPMAKMMLPMKPAAAASALSIQGVPMTIPMDMLLVSKAQTAGQEIHYLEDATFQLAMLDKIMTVETVREMLAKPEASDMKAMLQTYRDGDADGLLKEMQDTSTLGEDGEEKLDALLYDRNANWIPKLEALFAAKNAFVAVGAAHLIGPRSVVDLLTAKGYTVTRLAN